MEDSASNFYTALRSDYKNNGIFLFLENCDIKNAIVLDLIQRTHTPDDVTDTTVGKLVFKPVPLVTDTSK